MCSNLHIETWLRMMLAVNFTASILFQLPYANNTQLFNVVQTETSEQWQAINAEGEMVDSVLVTGDEGYYLRTEVDHQNCIAADPIFTTFEPDLTEFESMGEIFLNERKVAHFRFTEDSIFTSEDSTYYSAASLQEDFFCVPKGDMCIPYKWEMRSRSNFDSHTDFYVLDYLSYEPTADPTSFIFYEICKDVKGRQQHNHALSRFVDILRLKENMEESDRFINELRANPNFTFTVGHNKFSRFSPRERFAELRINRNSEDKHEKPEGHECVLPMGDMPKAIDWRVKGYSTPVRDQVACGSCWTFAAAGVVEGRINVLRKRPDLVKLSEQYIVDCFWDRTPEDWFIWSEGCEGGQPDNAMAWLIDAPLTLLSDYPYYGENDYCKKEKATYTEYKVTEVCEVPQSVEQLKLALLDGPVAVTIDVTDAMSFYTGGVFNDPACRTDFEDLVHNVLAVGYGVDEQFGEFWVIKNSWSNNWGMDGYIYISTRDNLCGVLTDAAYPVVQRV